MIPLFGRERNSPAILNWASSLSPGRPGSVRGNYRYVWLCSADSRFT